jgi:hypothetical protein
MVTAKIASFGAMLGSIPNLRRYFAIFVPQCFQRARAALSRADVVFFLGFGFGITNVDRLDFGCINRTARLQITRYNMTEAETNLLIDQPLSKAAIGNYGNSPVSWDCLEIIRQNVTVLVARY